MYVRADSMPGLTGMMEERFGGGPGTRGAGGWGLCTTGLGTKGADSVADLGGGGGGGRGRGTSVDAALCGTDKWGGRLGVVQ